MQRRRSLFVRPAAVLALASLSGVASAAPIVSGADQGVEGLRRGYERLEDSFATRESGIFLDPIADPASVASINAFFGQTAIADYQTFSGKHPFTALSSYDEYGDEGNFAGIASVGIAARLIYLRGSGAPQAEVDRARNAAVRAARAWHVYGAIGGPGVVARGVRRVTPEVAGDPPLPGQIPALVPLKDGGGAPLPTSKMAVWRAPVAPGFSDWIWFDDTSKDQLSGYALAAAWLWDALHDDPMVPPDVSANLAADLGATAHALMQVAPENGVDLCIRDADGRLTTFSDLNPRQLSPGNSALPADSLLKNGFNALLALGIVRAAYHVTGDASIGDYYYGELIGHRLMAVDMATTVSLIYLGDATNYSNVNMAAIGLASLGRFETDPYVRGQLATTLGMQFWSTGSDRDPSHVGQAWFDVIEGAYAADAPSFIPTRVTQDLGSFPPAPCFERDRQNCSPSDIAAGSCVGVDGMTKITIAPQQGHGGGAVAVDVLPMSIRPDSDFEWRSDPHRLNGNASTKMDPRGDWLAAYWLARVSELGAPSKNASPYARPPRPYTLSTGTGGGGGSGGSGGKPTPSAKKGCGCTVPEADAPAGGVAWIAGATLVLLARLRRRERR